MNFSNPTHIFLLLITALVLIILYQLYRERIYLFFSPSLNHVRGCVYIQYTPSDKHNDIQIGLEHQLAMHGMELYTIHEDSVERIKNGEWPFSHSDNSTDLDIAILGSLELLGEVIRDDKSGQPLVCDFRLSVTFYGQQGRILGSFVGYSIGNNQKYELIPQIVTAVAKSNHKYRKSLRLRSAIR